MFKILIFTIVTLISLVTSQGIGQGAGVGGQNGGSVAGPCVNGICPTGYSCNNNWCYSNSWNGGGGYCLTNIDCPRGSYCQYNSCVPYNSGSCANVFCPVGYYCVEGGCMQSNGGGGCQDNDSRFLFFKFA
uniref:Uncharacterized protein n=1 Tax=Acrobeloides nanus TaxID=290746 RepID=A0A914D7M7_9BILA